MALKTPKKNTPPDFDFLAIFGYFWLKNGYNCQNTISHEPMVVGSWLTPHFDWNIHISISV